MRGSAGRGTVGHGEVRQGRVLFLHIKEEA